MRHRFGNLTMKTTFKKCSSKILVTSVWPKITLTLLLEYKKTTSIAFIFEWLYHVFFRARLVFSFHSEDCWLVYLLNPNLISSYDVLIEREIKIYMFKHFFESRLALSPAIKTNLTLAWRFLSTIFCIF